MYYNTFIVNGNLLLLCGPSIYSVCVLLESRPKLLTFEED